TRRVDFVPSRVVIDAAHRKRVKYEAKCANIGCGFFPISFSSLGELEKDAVTLLKHILKFSITQDIGARAAIHIFNRISFAIAKGVGAQLAEFMEHDENPLSIDIRLLAALVEKCHAFAKALHYKEMEFEGALSKKMDVNPVTVVEALIHINNQLHQHKVHICTCLQGR
nr:serine/threonine-protein kinase TOR [Tanacetum cinerariifolium]